MNEASPFENLYQEELYLIPSRVIVVLGKDWETIGEEERTTLIKMMGALKLSLAAVQIITRHDFELDDLHAFSPRQIIALGSRMKTGALYEHLHEDGVSIVMGDHLDELDDQKKKRLWIALKQMFNI
ncbi:MAG TPA: hypothetical protein VD884_16345 [Ohtaekwangia sp.]|nr:hypothetical protein [Ohtaekwangia sp.]